MSWSRKISGRKAAVQARFEAVCADGHFPAHALEAVQACLKPFADETVVHVDTSGHVDTAGTNGNLKVEVTTYGELV